VDVLPSPRLGSEERAQRVPVLQGRIFPICPDRMPTVAQSILLRVAILRNDRRNPFWVPHGQSKPRSNACFSLVASCANAVRENRGKPLMAAALADLEPLNRLLAKDEGFGKTTTLAFQSGRRWRSPESLLLPIGEAMARMLAEEKLHAVICRSHASAFTPVPVFADAPSQSTPMSRQVRISRIR
jgi:hypothetical protein